jgi:SAM-dependent methyltransferase
VFADAYAALEGEEPWPRLAWLHAVLEQVRAPRRTAARGPRLRGHGVDVSHEQFSRARANVPEAKLLQAGALELDLPAASLDAVVALYALDHVPRERLLELLRAIGRWLREGEMSPAGSGHGSELRCSSAVIRRRGR